MTVPLWFFSAIAFWSFVTWYWCDFFTMSLDDFWHVVHATVADFNCIVVEKTFLELVRKISREATSFTKFSVAMQLKSATVAWTTSKIIKGHNEKVTSIPRDKRPKCNCRKKLEGNCQVNNVVYKCDVLRPLPKKVYLPLAEVEWKSRFYNHTLSFKHKRCSNKAKLSSYIWHLKSVSSETPNLKLPVWDAYHHTQISQRNTSCAYIKNRK